MANLRDLTKRTSRLRKDVDRLLRRTPDGAGGSATWGAILGKPSAFPPSAHTQSISTIVGLESVLSSLQEGVNAALTGPLVPDPDHLGFYVVAAESSVAPDPENPGFYVIGA